MQGADPESVPGAADLRPGDAYGRGVDPKAGLRKGLHAGAVRVSMQQMWRLHGMFDIKHGVSIPF
jgi:hypothetical protein